MSAPTGPTPFEPTLPAGLELEETPLGTILDETERRFTDDAVLHVYRHIDAYERIAKGIAAAGLTQHKRSADVITIALAARELGIGIMTALRGMYVVPGGKLSVETWLVELLASRLGVTKTVVESTGHRAEIVLHRPGVADIVTSFDLADAKRAELIADFDDAGNIVAKPRRETWRKYPRTMLYWRAVSQGMRMIAPDYFGGMYTVDETEGFHPRAAPLEGPTPTNAALGLAAVDPDPDELTEDDIEKMGSEIRAAVTRGLATPADVLEAATAALEGRWSDARAVWDRVRSAILRAGAP